MSHLVQLVACHASGRRSEHAQQAKTQSVLLSTICTIDHKIRWLTFGLEERTQVIDQDHEELVHKNGTQLLHHPFIRLAVLQNSYCSSK